MLKTQIIPSTSSEPGLAFHALFKEAVDVLFKAILEQQQHEDSACSSQDLKELNQTMVTICRIYKSYGEANSFSLDNMKSFLKVVPVLEKIESSRSFMKCLEELAPELYYQANREMELGILSTKANHSNNEIRSDQFVQLNEGSDQEKLKDAFTSSLQELPTFYGPLSRLDQKLILLRDKAADKLRAERIKLLQDSGGISSQAVKELEVAVNKLYTIRNFNVIVSRFDSDSMARFLSVAPLIEKFFPSLGFKRQLRQIVSKDSYLAYLKAAEATTPENSANNNVDRPNTTQVIAQQQEENTKQETLVQENDPELEEPPERFYGPVLEEEQQLIHLRDEVIKGLNVERMHLMQKVQVYKDKAISKRIEYLELIIFNLDQLDCRYPVSCSVDMVPLKRLCKIALIVDGLLPDLHFLDRIKQIIPDGYKQIEIDIRLDYLRSKEEAFFNRFSMAASEALNNLIRMLEVMNYRYFDDDKVDEITFEERSKFYLIGMMKFLRASQVLKEISKDRDLMNNIEQLVPPLYYQAHIAIAIYSLYMKSIDLSNRGYKDTAEILKNLILRLDSSFHEYFVSQTISHEIFKERCLRLIKENRVNLDMPRGITLILDVIVGYIYGLLCCGATIGCVCFYGCQERGYYFFRTESGKQLDRLEKCINNETFNSRIWVGGAAR